MSIWLGWPQIDDSPVVIVTSDFLVGVGLKKIQLLGCQLLVNEIRLCKVT